MKILVISDLHATLAALEAVLRVEPHFDQLIVLGDLVSYGPQPKEIIETVRQRAFVAVRGNHDHALGFNVDPNCSPANKPLALATLRHHRTLLTDEDVSYLSKHPRSQTLWLLTALFSVIYEVRRAFHLDDVRDIGFALVTGRPRPLSHGPFQHLLRAIPAQAAQRFYVAAGAFLHPGGTLPGKRGPVGTAARGRFCPGTVRL